MSLEHRRWPYENRLLVLAFCTVGCIMLDRFAIQYLSPLFVREFRMSQAEVGAVIGFLSVGWGISGWVFGSISDRRGRRIVIIPAVIAFSLLSAATGLVQSFVQLLAARFVMGITEGAALTPVYATVATESSPERRGLNLGVMQSSICLIGVALTPVLVTVLGSAFGWRRAFFLVAIPGLVMAALLWHFLREPTVSRRSEPGVSRVSLLSVFRYRNIWVSIGFGFLFGTWTACHYGFAPLYLTGPAYRMSLTAMGGLVGVSGVVGFVGQLVIPHLSDRYGRKPVIVLSSLGLALMCWVIPVGFLLPLMAALFLVFNLCQGGIPIGLAVIPTETVPVEIAATAVAVPVFALEVIGAFLSPIVAGALADATGYRALPIVIAGGAAFVAALLCLLYRETAPAKVGRLAAEAEAMPAVATL